MKNLPEFRAQVPKSVIDFIDAHTISRDGKKVSRGRVLELMTEMVKGQLAHAVIAQPDEACPSAPPFIHEFVRQL